jgi:hypothetical protein
MSLLEKIEPHAKRLEDTADKMETAGIGLHSRGGHVHVLRKMAADLRADAARGKVSHAFDGVYAVAAVAARAAGGALLTINAAADKNPRDAHLIRSLVARARHMGATIDPDKVIDVRQLDRELAGRPVADRMALKQALFAAGCIPA